MVIRAEWKLATIGRPYANIEKKSSLDFIKLKKSIQDLIKVNFRKSHISVSSERKVKDPTADSELAERPELPRLGRPARGQRKGQALAGEFVR